MEPVSLALGLAIGYGIGMTVMHFLSTRSLIRTIVDMKKQNFVHHAPIEPREESMYPFIRED